MDLIANYEPRKITADRWAVVGRVNEDLTVPVSGTVYGRFQGSVFEPILRCGTVQRGAKTVPRGQKTAHLPVGEVGGVLCAGVFRTIEVDSPKPPFWDHRRIRGDYPFF